MLTDRNLVCYACAYPYTVTIAEQEYNAAKGFRHLPRHCQACRRTRRAERHAERYSTSS